MKTKFLLTTAFISYAHGASVQLIAENTATGEQINTIAIDYERPLLSGDQLTNNYQITVERHGENWGTRTVQRAYSNDRPERSLSPQAGNYLILELEPNSENAATYAIETANTDPIRVRSKTATGDIVTVEKKQPIKIPKAYGKQLIYHIKQTHLLHTTDGTTLPPNTFSISADTAINPLLRHFQAGQSPDGSLNYRLYIPPTPQTAPYLIIFLHGSGQVGEDNLAPLLSSKGATATLNHEQGYVLVPQYRTVFDDEDPQGGIHWQTPHRRQQVYQLIEKVLAEHPEIDRNRIYLNGLSRGAEGALYLLQDHPDTFAAALMMGGREANTVEWIDGNATADSLKMLADKPIWFFHSIGDPISPIEGTQKNVHILQNELHNPNVRYTEFTFHQAGDNGIINNSPHNTWDAVYNSPAVIQWLLTQRKTPK